MDQSSTQIRRDIERTRGDMEDTIDAMRWKMDLRHRAVDSAKQVHFDKRTVGIALAVLGAAFWPKRALMLALLLRKKRRSPIVRAIQRVWRDSKPK